MSGATAMKGFRERFGEPADTPALVALINLAFRPEQVAIEGDRINAEKLQPFFTNGRFLVLEDADGLAGCVYAEVRGSRGYIGLLALRPELKGRGLGRLLMGRAEDFLSVAGCMAADLRTISARNDLVPMYKHLGYQETGTAALPPEIPLKMPCHFITMSKRLR
ncbi:MAG TPA: GNAT family N-acetyltransferase [Candidatus Eisenbacteria bacterium]|nr:GNAT family N-acetyltransferase [Candidatus Eisenbacteria bacterium]